MKHTGTYGKTWRMFAGLLILLPLTLWAGLSLGSVEVPAGEIIPALLGDAATPDSWRSIIREVRLPRTLGALAIGMALPVAGLMMQSLFRNALAGPYVLGVSSGASLGVAVLLLSGSMGLGIHHPWMMIWAAVTGAGLLMAVVLYFSAKVSNHVSLLVIGMMIAGLAGAVVGLLQYFSSPEALKSFVVWTFGDMGGIRRQHLKYLLPVTAVALVLSMTFVKSLDAGLLGEEGAANAGFSPRKIRWKVLLLTGLLAGTATAFAGPVAFIGLAVPHLVRRMSGSPSHRVLLPGVMLAGGVLLVLCDIIARLPGSSHTLPLNIITSLAGIPVVISVVLQTKH